MLVYIRYITTVPTSLFFDDFTMKLYSRYLYAQTTKVYAEDDKDDDDDEDEVDKEEEEEDDEVLIMK